jgi:hypothetical protein
MGKLSERLAKAHGNLADRCDTVDKCLGKIIGMAKASKSDLKPDDDDGLCGNLEKIRTAFAAGTKFHKEEMAECLKVSDGDLTKGTSDLAKRIEHLENTIIPTRVAGVTPNAPGVTAVPRAGQRSVPSGERPNVPVAFEKLVAIED